LGAFGFTLSSRNFFKHHSLFDNIRLYNNIRFHIEIIKKKSKNALFLEKIKGFKIHEKLFDGKLGTKSIKLYEL